MSPARGGFALEPIKNTAGDSGSHDLCPPDDTTEESAPAGLYLHWDGRRNYRTSIPAPRVIEPVPDLGYGDTSVGRLIEGDNLQVMVSLRSQYTGAFDVAYLDPPYNTGKGDFRYSDRRFHDPNADSDDAVYVTNEDGGRHTKWLNYMGPRLWLTWELLADTGVCFVSINDVELYRLGLLLDEIFGEKNRLGILVWKQAVDNNPTRIATEHEYILCYAKNASEVPERWQATSRAKQWLLEKYGELLRLERDPEKLQVLWRNALAAQRKAYRLAVAEGRMEDEVDLGRMDRFRNIDSRGPWAKDWHLEKPYEGGYFYDIPHPVTRKPVKQPPRGYRYPPESMQRLLDDDRIVFGKDHTETAQLRRYLRDSSDALRSVITIPGRNGSDRLAAVLPDATKRFAHPKPVELIEMLLSAAGDIDALILDPFAGSGTTGEAVMKLNAADGGVRRFVLIEEGEPDDRFCRTLTAPRLRSAIELDGYAGGFVFETTGTRLDRSAILQLEREAIANLVVQTDPTGAVAGIRKVSGTWVIGANPRREAICLCWNGRNDSRVTAEVLKQIFAEAKAMGLLKPVRIYGSTCDVGETDSFVFCQIPDAILASLQLDE
jgi:adenine-specific DNA-methyltransferase